MEGVILDRGFCTYEDLMTLESLKLKYVIMVPNGTKGSRTMLKNYGRQIFWKSRYAINKRGVFGISKEEVIWGTHPDVTGILNLYFGAVRGCFDGIKILEEVFDEKEKAEKICANGKKPVITKKYEDVLLIIWEMKNRDIGLNVIMTHGTKHYIAMVFSQCYRQKILGQSVLMIT